MSQRRCVSFPACLLGLLLFAHSAAAQQGGATATPPGRGLSPVISPAAAPSAPAVVPAPSVAPPAITNAPESRDARERAEKAAADKKEAAPPVAPEAPQRNEFQDFVALSLGRPLPMFGYGLFADVPSTFAPVDRIPVTPDYVIGPGDEILVRAWGQIDIDYRVTVDRNGAINIPRVGNLNVAGIRYQELEGFIKSAVGRLFRNFELNVTLGQLRSIQIFVVGQARRPGSYTVSSLSTLVNALFASGGPSLRGSMRGIQLKRGTQLITEFDVYDVLIKGDKSKDVRLLSGDLIYIPPIGNLVAIAGSVNEPAIYELKNKTTLGDLMTLAGGLSTTAAGRKATVERIVERTARKVDEFTLDQAGLAREVQDGDLVRVFALSQKFDNAVTLRGSVANPGRYPWRDGLRIRDVIPDTDALIVPDYWLRQNAAPRIDTSGLQRFLRTEVKRTFDEINWDYAVVERLNREDLTTTLIPFNLGRAVRAGDPLANVLLLPGDVVTIFSKADLQVPIAKQTKYVRLDGEVVVPGIYQILPGETLRQLLARIGGFTANAYLYGAEFTRESARALQQRRLDESLDRFAQEIERTAAQTATSKENADSAQLSAEGQRRLLVRMREIKANGRIVLSVTPDRAQINDVPDIALDDGDHLTVPSRPATVGVLGAVYSANLFLYKPGSRLDAYLAQSGGPTRDADAGRIYVVNANGSVSGRAQSSAFSSDDLQPGDTIVVPENLDKYRLTRALKDWSQIFYQFALGVAGLKVLKDL